MFPKILFLGFLLLLLFNKVIHAHEQDKQSQHQAIVYLLTGSRLDERVKQIKEAFALIVTNYIEPYQLQNSTKFIIFHDKYDTSSLIHFFHQKWSQVVVDMVDVSDDPTFKTPEWHKHDPPGARYAQCGHKVWHEGYVFMSAYRTLNMWLHPVLNDIDYVMLVDTDLYFMKPIPYDLFKRAKDEDLTYAYHECTREKAIDCLDGYVDAIGEFVKTNNIKPTHLDMIEFNTAYAGNFNIRKMSFFRSDGYISFAKHLLSKQDFYRYRWADQNVWAMGLALFEDINRVGNWYNLFDDKIIVHKSASLGRKSWQKSSKQMLTPEQNVLCKHNSGCVCDQSIELRTQRMQSYGLDMSIVGPRYAVVTMISSDNFVEGALVLLYSLRETNTLTEDIDFVVLLTGEISQDSTQKLTTNGAIFVNVTNVPQIDRRAPAAFKDRYATRSWLMFAKLNVFGMTQYDRILYLDADILVLKSLRHLFDDTNKFILSAIPEKRGLEPEFNAGFLVLKPNSTLLDDMKKHLDDNYLCGYRATDQSFLCHYFHSKHSNWIGGVWNPLPRSTMALVKVSTASDLLTASSLHFNGPKPWMDRNRHSPLYDRWHQAKERCGQRCDPM